VKILDQIPESYRDAVVGARLVDVVIYAVNPDTNAVVNGEAGFVDDAGTYRPVVMFSGTGKDFVQRRSLLKDQAPLITPVQNNLTLLEGIIDQFVQDPENTVVRVYSRGTVSPPVSGQEICVEILVQVDGKVSTD